jgi:hypothetical protein
MHLMYICHCFAKILHLYCLLLQDSVLWTLNDSEETKSNIAAELNILGTSEALIAQIMLLPDNLRLPVRGFG